MSNIGTWFIENLGWIIAIAALCTGLILLRAHRHIFSSRRTGGGGHTPPSAGHHGTDEHEHEEHSDHPTTSGGGLATFFKFILGLAFLALCVVGIIWFWNEKHKDNVPTSSHYYTYQLYDPQGRVVGKPTPVLVKVTPDTIEFGFGANEGGAVSCRASRAGDGQWIRRAGTKLWSGTLQIKNLTTDKNLDYQKWQREVVLESGPDHEDRMKGIGSYKACLTRGP